MITEYHQLHVMSIQHLDSHWFGKSETLWIINDNINKTFANLEYGNEFLTEIRGNVVVSIFSQIYEFALFTFLFIYKHVDYYCEVRALHGS